MGLFRFDSTEEEPNPLVNFDERMLFGNGRADLRRGSVTRGKHNPVNRVVNCDKKSIVQDKIENQFKRIMRAERQSENKQNQRSY
jgi:hypothetical protein